MQSEYLYGIVIVVVLLVLLFVYNMMKGAPATPTAPPANANASTNVVKVVPTTMTINYNTQNSTMALSVINSKTVTSSSTIPNGVNTIVDTVGGVTSVTMPLYYIQYDGRNGINFAVDTSASSSSSRYYIQHLSIWGISATDSNTSHPFYNTNTATVNGSILTLTNGTDELSIALPAAFA